MEGIEDNSEIVFIVSQQKCNDVTRTVLARWL